MLIISGFLQGSAICLDLQDSYTSYSTFKFKDLMDKHTFIFRGFNKIFMDLHHSAWYDSTRAFYMTHNDTDRITVRDKEHPT